MGGLLAWSAGAYKLKLRKEWNGWSERQKRRCLPLVVNNTRLFIPAPYHISAYSVQSGRWLGSEAVAEGSNEIPAVQRLLQRVDLAGSLVTADAPNTQTKTARIIVQQKGGDYLFTVKGNQSGVAANVQQIYNNRARAFSPSGADVDRSNL